MGFTPAPSLPAAPHPGAPRSSQGLPLGRRARRPEASRDSPGQSPETAKRGVKAEHQ